MQILHTFSFCIIIIALKNYQSNETVRREWLSIRMSNPVARYCAESLLYNILCYIAFIINMKKQLSNAVHSITSQDLGYFWKWHYLTVIRYINKLNYKLTLIKKSY